MKKKKKRIYTKFGYLFVNYSKNKTKQFNFN